MRQRNLPLLFLICILYISCIKDEAPNAEADIVTCVVTEDILISNPIVENNKITLLIKPYIDVDLTQIKLEFTLTPGATIEPPSGTVRDFSSPQTYTVTSEDKNWKKEYTITCDIHGIRTEYDFEHSELVANSSNKKFYQFYEIIPETGEKLEFWASGNAGFAITAPTTTPPEDYPTSPYELGKEGQCLKLVTRSTGFLGALVKKPIAAGNLFIGTFDANTAMSSALKATHFGRPFNFIPTYLTGYYKYKAGEKFTNSSNKEVPDRVDNFDIYAIMYETDENVEYLDGTNSLTSPNLISIARINPLHKKETDEWTYFSIPFEYLPEKAIDPDKLVNSKYSVSVVFSSSIDGASFEGAVGSTLLIDEVKLVHHNDE